MHTEPEFSTTPHITEPIEKICLYVFLSLALISTAPVLRSALQSVHYYTEMMHADHDIDGIHDLEQRGMTVIPARMS